MTQTLIKPPTKDELTKKGFTNRIKIAEGQTAEKLLRYGFTNYHKPRLYFCRNLGHEITFNLAIDKSTLEITRIDVLDEDFGQPFDYQASLLRGNNGELAKEIYHKVNSILTKLQSDGIIVGFEEGMYV